MNTKQTSLKKKKKKINQFAVVSSPVVSKLSLQLKKEKRKQASKALQHYYVHSFSGERESWCHDEGEGRETETPVKRESFLAQGLEL